MQRYQIAPLAIVLLLVVLLLALSMYAWQNFAGLSLGQQVAFGIFAPLLFIYGFVRFGGELRRSRSNPRPDGEQKKL